MRVLRDPAEIPPSARGGAVAIGNFDGVHVGHARLIEQLVAAASAVGGPAVVLTFEPHPVRLLRPEQCPPPLTWTERKAELLVELGVDWMVAYPTDAALLELTPRDFFETIVRQLLDARALVEGPNFFFGHERAGTIEVLRGLAEEEGISLTVVEPCVRGEPSEGGKEAQFVSSSRIRRLIAEGRVGEARGMLTQPYRIRGMVTHGAGRGAKLGFPTANLDAVDTLLPGEGVYAGRAWVEGQARPAAIHIGPNPTFGQHLLKVEVHVIDRHPALYGQPLEVDFLERLRDIHPFPSPEALHAQLTQDVGQARRIGEEDLKS